MNRRRVMADSSLELLLDTICNTFGGVLFIAILVSVLLRMTVKAVAPQEDHVANLEILELQTELEDLRAKMTVAQFASERQADLQGKFSNPEMASAVSELQELHKSRDDALSQRDKLQSQVTDAKAAKSAAENRMQSFAKELSGLRLAAQKIDAQLAAELESRSQKVRLPKLQDSVKPEVALILRYNRIYFNRHYSSLGTPGDPNLEDFFVLEDGISSMTITPKPFRGLDLLRAETRAELVAKLKRFNPRLVDLAAVVHQDSFESFTHLKVIMAELGYKYRLITWENNTLVSEGRVDDAQVQ